MATYEIRFISSALKTIRIVDKDEYEEKCIERIIDAAEFIVCASAAEDRGSFDNAQRTIECNNNNNYNKLDFLIETNENVGRRTERKMHENIFIMRRDQLSVQLP